MLNKQRTDFLHAYENHVHNFHKELYNLRARVTQIANDTAREQKVQQLKEQKEHYHHEAMRLDIATADVTDTLKAATARILKLGNKN